MNRDEITAFLDWLSDVPPPTLDAQGAHHGPTNQEAFAAGYRAGQQQTDRVFRAADNARRVALLEIQCARLKVERDEARAALAAAESIRA